MNENQNTLIANGTRILGRQLARELTLDELMAVGGGQQVQCPHGTSGCDVMGSRMEDDCSGG